MTELDVKCWIVERSDWNNSVDKIAKRITPHFKRGALIVYNSKTKILHIRQGSK